MFNPIWTHSRLFWERFLENPHVHSGDCPGSGQRSVSVSGGSLRLPDHGWRRVQPAHQEDDPWCGWSSPAQENAELRVFLQVATHADSIGLAQGTYADCQNRWWALLWDHWSSTHNEECCWPTPVTHQDIVLRKHLRWRFWGISAFPPMACFSTPWRNVR